MRKSVSAGMRSRCSDRRSPSRAVSAPRAASAAPAVCGHSSSGGYSVPGSERAVQRFAIEHDLRSTHGEQSSRSSGAHFVAGRGRGALHRRQAVRPEVLAVVVHRRHPRRPRVTRTRSGSRLRPAGDDARSASGWPPSHGPSSVSARACTAASTTASFAERSSTSRAATRWRKWQLAAAGQHRCRHRAHAHGSWQACSWAPACGLHPRWQRRRRLGLSTADPQQLLSARSGPRTTPGASGVGAVCADGQLSDRVCLAEQLVSWRARPAGTLPQR